MSGLTICRSLIRRFEFGSPDHIAQCITITGEVAADVIEILSDGPSATKGSGSTPA